MSRTRRNPPGWTTAKTCDSAEIVPDHALHVVTDYNRGNIGMHDLKDNPKRRGFKWKLVAGICCNRAAKRYLKAERNRAERRQGKIEF